jgi:hypothetical protein
MFATRAAAAEYRAKGATSEIRAGGICAGPLCGGYLRVRRSGLGGCACRSVYPERTPELLAGFGRSQDPTWRSTTIALR